MFDGNGQVITWRPVNMWFTEGNEPQGVKYTAFGRKYNLENDHMTNNEAQALIDGAYYYDD